MDDDDFSPPRKSGLKIASSKSPQVIQKPSKEEFKERVEQAETKASLKKKKASELAVQFKNLLSNKELAKNKSVLQERMEKDLLQEMVSFASELDNDPEEAEGIGTLMWVSMLLKFSLAQRDRMNELEYQLSLTKNE